MAGQFFMIDMKKKALEHVLKHYPGATLGPLQHHPNPGWNAASRAIITAVKAGNPPAGRAGLPPHKYLELPSQPDAEQVKYWWSNEAVWVNQLTRPANISKGLNGPGGADQPWREGRCREALLAELRVAPVSIEIYYLDGLEIS